MRDVADRFPVGHTLHIMEYLRMGMNANIVFGKFFGTKKFYRSKNGGYHFNFKFVNKGRYIDIYCTYHPSLNGHSSNPAKTHLFRSGKLCFASGHEAHSQSRAEILAAQWAEYFVEYRKTGIAQS